MLHIVLPVHNRAPITARFLASLREQTFGDYRLLLVDDGCTDDTVAIARQSLPAERLHVLRGDGNLWWAGALQMAYEHLRKARIASNDAVLIINDDTQVKQDFLKIGLSILEDHPTACIQSLGIDRQSGRVDRGVVADLDKLTFRHADLGEAVNCLSTRGLIMKISTFIDSGGFKPSQLPHYLSDYEFTLRLNKNGHRLLCDERFYAEIDDKLSGISDYPNTKISDFLTISFSNRAKFNPKHWTLFIIIACPAMTAFINIAKVWFRFFRALIRSLATTIISGNIFFNK